MDLRQRHWTSRFHRYLFASSVGVGRKFRHVHRTCGSVFPAPPRLIGDCALLDHSAGCWTAWIVLDFLPSGCCLPVAASFKSILMLQLWCQLASYGCYRSHDRQIKKLDNLIFSKQLALNADTLSAVCAFHVLTVWWGVLVFYKKFLNKQVQIFKIY